MKNLRSILLLSAFLPALTVGSFWTCADEKPKPLDVPKPSVRIVGIPPKAVDLYNETHQHTVDAQKAYEASAVYKDYLIAQSQEQSAMLYAFAEAGLKPSEGCKPVFKDAKLDHFECPEKPTPLPKEHEKSRP